MLVKLRTLTHLHLLLHVCDGGVLLSFAVNCSRWCDQSSACSTLSKCGSAGDVEVGVKSTFGLIFRTYHEVILSSLAKKLQIMAKTRLLPIFMWRFWPQSILVKMIQFNKSLGTTDWKMCEGLQTSALHIFSHNLRFYGLSRWFQVSFHFVNYGPI